MNELSDNNNFLPRLNGNNQIKLKRTLVKILLASPIFTIMLMVLNIEPHERSIKMAA